MSGLVVLKLGGRVAADAVRDALAEAGGAAVVVHGAGPQITEELARRGIEARFVRGRRVTTPEVLEVVRESLDAVNAEVCAAIGARRGTAARRGGRAAGPAGSVARPRGRARGRARLPPSLDAVAAGRVPVVSPLAVGPLNVNADEAAAALAVGLGAERILFVSDVPGVLVEGALARVLPADEAEAALDAGEFEGGIVPKLVAAVRAARGGVHASIGATEVPA